MARKLFLVFLPSEFLQVFEHLVTLIQPILILGLNFLFVPAQVLIENFFYMTKV